MFVFSSGDWKSKSETWGWNQISTHSKRKEDQECRRTQPSPKYLSLKQILYDLLSTLKREESFYVWFLF